MLEGLRRMVGAKAATSIRARHEMNGAKRKVTVLTGQSIGIEEPAAQEAVARYLATLSPADPLSEPLYSQPGRQVTRGREQLMDRPAWHRSAHFNEVRRAAGIDDCIASKIVLGPGGQVQTVCLHRAVGDAPFTARQWELVDLFHSEMYPLIDAPHVGPSTYATLPPRLRQVLHCLLAGDSAKDAARKLGLSVHTARDYVKDSYRHFNVSSRAELLAQLMRQPPAPDVQHPGNGSPRGPADGKE
jgi:DNA-binding CsgD family transcriptional regulator